MSIAGSIRSLVDRAKNSSRENLISQEMNRRNPNKIARIKNKIVDTITKFNSKDTRAKMAAQGQAPQVKAVNSLNAFAKGKPGGYKARKSPNLFPRRDDNYIPAEESFETSQPRF